jgi:hypothetical protein
MRQEGSQKLPTHYTCNGLYNTLKGKLAKRISTHLVEQSLLLTEQKGCHPGSKCYKDQLVISKAIYEDFRRRNNNLSLAWIDYQKAFDSIPHSWVELISESSMPVFQTLKQKMLIILNHG